MTKVLKLTHWSTGIILVNPDHITEIFAADPAFGKEDKPAGTMIVFQEAEHVIRVLEDFDVVIREFFNVIGTE
jgi:hypothetical protein